MSVLLFVNCFSTVSLAESCASIFWYQLPFLPSYQLLHKHPGLGYQGQEDGQTGKATSFFMDVLDLAIKDKH